MAVLKHKLKGVENLLAVEGSEKWLFRAALSGVVYCVCNKRGIKCIMYIEGQSSPHETFHVTIPSAPSTLWYDRDREFLNSPGKP